MKQQPSSENEWITLAQHGNTAAFGELYKLHLEAIYGYVFKRVGEVGEVENLTQTIFLKAWQGLARYQPSQVPFRAWLYRIAHNAVIDYYRTKKVAVSLDEQPDQSANLPADVDLPEESLVSQERYDFLRQAIAKLRPAYQQVISLRFLSELDYAETAKVLGKEVNSIRVLQFRALEALHKILTQGS